MHPGVGNSWQNGGLKTSGLTKHKEDIKRLGESSIVVVVETLAVLCVTCMHASMHAALDVSRMNAS